MRIVTSAPNKIILCGEHFVVYGAPALAIPTNNRNRVILISRDGEPVVVIRSNLGEARYWPNEKRFEGAGAFEAFVPAVDYAFRGSTLDETLDIEILHSGAPKGMGSSSSLGAALGLALFAYLRKQPTDADLFECGQLVDEIAHGGKPSGIDARTTSRGKPQKFQRSFEPVQFNFEDAELQLPGGTALIVVDTYRGEREMTGQLIERFAQANGITKKPNELTEDERRSLFSDYNIVYREFLSHCRKEGNAEWLGNAFNENHKLLMAVTMPEIEEVRETALRNGALGAKLTGAGGKGGAVIVLAQKEQEQNIIKKLGEIGYSSFSVEIAKEGAKVEMVL